MMMQFQADILDVPVVRPVVTETTALGAAYLAGLAVGFWASLEEIAAQWRMARRFEPRMAADERQVAARRRPFARLERVRPAGRPARARAGPRRFHHN